MAESPLLGAKVRALRRREKLTQAELASRLGVSASYLNLIENNRRPLTANVLLKLAQCFQLDLSAFASSEDAQLAEDLRELFSDPMFEQDDVSKVELSELATNAPGAARAMLKLYESYRATRQNAESLADRAVEHGGGDMLSTTPTEEINDLLQRHHNHFPVIEEAAAELWARAALADDDVHGGLVQYLSREHGIDVQVVQADESQAMRRYMPERKRITLSEVMPPRTRRFQLAHQAGLILYGECFDAMALDQELRSPRAQSITRIVLANYFAAAVLMPYEPFLAAAEDNRYDIELLAHRYRCSFEQVCHRLTTLRRKGAQGVPLHFLRIDIAGNISKRFGGSGISMPRFSGACPRWNIHAAFLTPGMISVQLSRMPDGTAYFCIARTIRRDSGGYNMPHTVHSIGLGCEVRHAKRLVYSDGYDLDSLGAATPVGVTCRTCERMDCEQRVFPPMQYPLSIDENVRGVSFFAPTSESVKKPTR